MLRLALFTGLQGDDDRLYSASAWRLSRGERPDAPDLFRTRIAYLAPVALWYRTIGVNVFGLILPSLAASLGLVALAYGLGRTLYSENVARAAAAFTALVPLDIFYGTTASTDLPLAALLGVGTWLLLRPDPSAGRAVLAGLAWGAAHLTKESGLLLALPSLFLLWKPERRKALLIAGLTAAGVVAVELLTYGLIEGNPLYRIQLARAAQSGSLMQSASFWRRLAALPSSWLNPYDLAFVFGGGLQAGSLLGAVWALRRDRQKSGAVAFWWLTTGLVLTLFPFSLLPYRPALDVQPRMYAVMILPGALLASVFLVDVLGSRSRRAAWAVAAVAALLSMTCAVRLHQDGRVRRIGVEWAHRELAAHPGASVVTDPRTAELLRMMSSYAPAFSISSYGPDHPPPRSGTLLLQVPRQAAPSARWDKVAPPPWWNEPPPPRRIAAEASFRAPWPLRRNPDEDERTVLSRVD